MDMGRKNLRAQWAFDTRPVLGRFHLWLESVEESWIQGECRGDLAFTGDGLYRNFIMTAAVTALGTRLFGRYGEGAGLDKTGINRVKKDSDAMSAYAMSEGFWYLTRSLPENHALMVSLGEGLMPKGGETPDMGSNPLLGFGRVYARPQVAKFVDRRVQRLINEPAYEWAEFHHETQAAGITIWGAAVDTLENTTRFASGADTGPLTVCHVFDQPLHVVRPYEGYMGTMVLPRAVVDNAARRSVLINYHTPRSMVMEAVRETYPDIPVDRIHVWTLGGEGRKARIGSLWREWQELGAHITEDGWHIPGLNLGTFNDSGTYAPVFAVGVHEDEEGERHLFLLDGYAATAEATQAASLDPVLDLHTCLSLFTSRFHVPWQNERNLMQLDPGSPDFARDLSAILEHDPDGQEVEEYRDILLEARTAGMPVGKRTVTVDDFLPEKEWRVLALAGYMLPDPYTGSPGVEEMETGVYRVTSRAATRCGMLEVKLTLRLMEAMDEMKLVFSPLLDRFYAGTDYRTRPVKVSDSGRIRNELQTLASESLEYLPDDRIRVHFDRIDDAVMAPDKKALIRDVLNWYKTNHPAWFRWVEIG